MNVAFINSTRKWGGVKTWCLDMASALPGLGHPAWIVGRPGPFTDKARALGIPCLEHGFGFDYNPASIAFFRRFFRANRIRVAVCNVSKDLRTAGVAARSLGIPVVHRVGAPGDLRDRFKVRLDQRLLRPWILSSSEFTRRSVLERVPLLRRHPSATIHPGTPVPEAAPRALHAPRTLVSTSQVNPDKGHADVLQALAALRAEGLDFRYIVVGAGSAEQALQEQARGLGLADAVEWTGFVTDVPAHLARADVFVLPSLCEPLGIALEEAMAHGLAPVARRAGGVPEIWPPGLERYMVRPEDAVAGFREALGRLLRMEDQDLLALQAAVRAHAAATFSLEAKARELAEWLEGVVRETPHA